VDEAVAFYRDVMRFRASDRYEPGDNPYTRWGICSMHSGDLYHELSIIDYGKEAGVEPAAEKRRAPEVGLRHLAFEGESKNALDAQSDNSEVSQRDSVNELPFRFAGIDTISISKQKWKKMEDGQHYNLKSETKGDIRIFNIACRYIQSSIEKSSRNRLPDQDQR